MSRNIFVFFLLAISCVASSKAALLNRFVPVQLIRDCPGINEEFVTCGSACEPTCTDPNPQCTDQCIIGCQCKEGFIRSRIGECTEPCRC